MCNIQVSFATLNVGIIILIYLEENKIIIFLKIKDKINLYTC